jgi:hypothetical protein
MGIRFRLLCLAFLLPAAAASAQSQSPAAAPLPPGEASSRMQAGSKTVQTYDGGTRQMLESIFIPPIAHAPFSLTLGTEWTRTMANGGTYTVANKRQIMRDSAGRIYQERWWLVPKGGKMESKMNFIQISDPAAHTLYNCETATKHCYLQVYRGSTAANYQPAVGRSGALADGSGYATHEDLGGNTIAGFDTVGYRDTTTLNPGTYGNDQPMVSMREFWYSNSSASTCCLSWTIRMWGRSGSRQPMSTFPSRSRATSPSRRATPSSISGRQGYRCANRSSCGAHTSLEAIQRYLFRAPRRRQHSVHSHRRQARPLRLHIFQAG